jgi:hypothetical protein
MSAEDPRRLQPRDLAIAAGLQPNSEPRIVYANLFQGAGFPIAMDQGFVSVYGGWDWLPSGSKEDPELRRHFDKREEKAFKRRAKELANASADDGASPWQQYKFLEMCKGDIVIIRNSNSTKTPATPPSKYFIGLWSKDFDEAGGAAWHSIESFGVHQADMSATSDADSASRTRLWRPVTWLREGDWMGKLEPNTIDKFRGLQAATIQEFKQDSKPVFLDLLRNSRPLPATTHDTRKKREAETIDLQESDDEEKARSGKKNKPAASSSSEPKLSLMDRVTDLAKQLNLTHLLPGIPSVLKEAERMMEVTPPPAAAFMARADALLAKI